MSSISSDAEYENQELDLEEPEESLANAPTEKITAKRPTATGAIEKWTKEDVHYFISEHFTGDVADKFLGKIRCYV